MKNLIKNNTPNYLLRLLLKISNLPNKYKSRQKIFSEIYRKNKWGRDPDNPASFYSGSGSYNNNTSLYIAKIKEIIRENNIKSITEIGCGDLNIAKNYLQDIEIYNGCDIVPELIKNHKHNINVLPTITNFFCLDACTDELPGADCLIIRQVLQHLDNDSIILILNRLTDFHYIIITEHIPKSILKPNLDKIIGSDIRVHYESGVFLNLPPFNIQNLQVILKYDENLRFGKNEIAAEMTTYLIKND
jgi:hypothetical protein